MDRLAQISDCMRHLEGIRNWRKHNPGKDQLGAILGEVDTLCELHELIHDPEHWRKNLADFTR